MVSKLDLTDAKNSDTAHIKSIEITSILNGLQGKHNQYPVACNYVFSCYKSDSVKAIRCFLIGPEFCFLLLREIKSAIDWGLEIFLLLVDLKVSLNFSYHRTVLYCGFFRYCPFPFPRKAWFVLCDIKLYSYTEFFYKEHQTLLISITSIMISFMMALLLNI